MTVLEKCVYLADYCEPGRRLPRRRTRCASWRRRRWTRPSARRLRLSLLDIIGRGRGVVPGALALYNETHAGN